MEGADKPAILSIRPEVNRGPGASSEDRQALQCVVEDDGGFASTALKDLAVLGKHRDLGEVDARRSCVGQIEARQLRYLGGKVRGLRCGARTQRQDGVAGRIAYFSQVGPVAQLVLVRLRSSEVARPQAA